MGKFDGQPSSHSPVSGIVPDADVPTRRRCPVANTSLQIKNWSLLWR
jgi:hypothetical protein